MENSFISLDRGMRLKQQRKKFGLTQKDAAVVAGVGEQSWVRFEKRGEPFDLRVVQLLEEKGFDMMFVIFGVPKIIESDVTELIGLYNSSEDAQKDKIIQMVRLMAQPD